MTRQVASVDPHAGIKEAALYLQRHKYGCLPVLKGRKLGSASSPSRTSSPWPSICWS